MAYLYNNCLSLQLLAMIRDLQMENIYLNYYSYITAYLNNDWPLKSFVTVLIIGTY